jgi:8-oxo-dGTP diphosphatase
MGESKFTLPRSMNRHVIRVVAAVILRDGKILLGQRKMTDTHPLKWEFPGGKLEKGESPRKALVRELKEELGIEAHIGAELVRYEHTYPRRTTIQLLFFAVNEFRGAPAAYAFEQIVWEDVKKLPSYDFLDGDIDFVRRLASGEFNLSS